MVISAICAHRLQLKKPAWVNGPYSNVGKIKSKNQKFLHHNMESEMTQNNYKE